MRIDLQTNSIEDREKLVRWLSPAAKIYYDAFLECIPIIRKLNREIAYYTQKKKFEERRRQAAQELDNDGEEIFPGVTRDSIIESAKHYTDELDERLKKAVSTYKKVLDGKYDDALDFIRRNLINDEAIAYGDDKKYGGKRLKAKIIEVQDMLIEFIHQKADNMEKHELYNDEIDEWYFKFKDNPDSAESEKYMNDSYFFPSEVFVIKIKDNYFYYCETSGQGTTFDMTIMDDTGIENLANEYGLTVCELKEKAYDLKDYFEEN